MKPIHRRLRKLEEGFRLMPETEADRRLLERLEAGRRRVAEAEARGEFGDAVYQDQARSWSHRDRRAVSWQTIVEILRQGRERAWARAEQQERAADALAEAGRDTSPKSRTA